MNSPLRIKEICGNIPPNVQILAATKSRSVDEIKQAVNSGIKIIGENYVQEAKSKYSQLKGKCEIHLIGHLQTNKVKDAVEIFDMIQTVDSVKLAKEINKRTKKVMHILVEINIGREKNKSGIFPEDIFDFLREISQLEKIKVNGLMTMGPDFSNKENYRPLFKEMKTIFESVKKQKIPNVSMEILSMGMSDSYDVAIEEGTNMVRLGIVLFGEKKI